MGAPRKGQGGSPDPLDFDINFSHIITVARRVEIQMHFWKGAKFAGSAGHPMTKMRFRGLRPPDPLTRGSAPGPRGGSAPRLPLYACAPHSPWCPQPLTPSTTYHPLEKILWAPLGMCVCVLVAAVAVSGLLVL